MPPFFDPRTALFDAYAIPQAQRYFQEHGLNVDGYGAFQPTFDMKPPIASGRTVRRQLNCVGILLAILVPFALFIGTFWTMSFGLFYKRPSTALLVIALAIFFVLIIGAFSAQAKKTEMITGNKSWHHFLFSTGALAIFLGLVLGYLNLLESSRLYFDYISLRKADGVDPGQWQGQQLLDAGEIDFKAGSKLDTSLHSLWHKSKTYCVAPVVSGDGVKLANYDFWAVGMNCCSSSPNDFSCGGTQDAMGLAGLRVMDNTEIEGYKLAVEQATAAHNIQSLRPIFLKMMPTPYNKIKGFYNDAKWFCIECCILYIIMQTVLVLRQAYFFGINVPSGYLDMDGTKGSYF